MSGSRSAAIFWLAIGSVGFALVPWYAVTGSIWSPDWIVHWLSKDNGPA